MSPEAARFARLGAALLLLVAHLARTTKGAFPPGPAAVALALCVSVTEAARNAFAALGADDTLPTEDRARLLEAAALFRRAAGLIATRIPGPRGGAALASLAGFSAVGRDGGDIASYFATALPVASPATMDEAAGAALDALRRDPLVLASEGAASLLLLMDTVTDGVTLFGVRAS